MPSLNMQLLNILHFGICLLLHSFFLVRSTAFLVFVSNAHNYRTA